MSGIFDRGAAARRFPTTTRRFLRREPKNFGHFTEQQPFVPLYNCKENYLKGLEESWRED